MFKVKNLDDILSGNENPSIIKVTKKSIQEKHPSYEDALKIYNYYLQKTRFTGNNNWQIQTISSIIQLFKDYSQEELCSCVDKYALTITNDNFIFSPYNFFGNFAENKAFFRNFLYDAEPQIPIDTIPAISNTPQINNNIEEDYSLLGD